MNIFVVFGSSSDESTYRPLCEKLKEAGHEVYFEVISAHRDPDKLGAALAERKYDLIVAGAGLAAHLPGVIASKTMAPVVGISVDANFGGLDALLSIVQMPFGVPVLASSPSKTLEIIGFLDKIKDYKAEAFNTINFVFAKKTLNYEYMTLELDRTKKLLLELNIEFTESEEPTKTGLNIVMVIEEKNIIKNQKDYGPIIHVPVLDKTMKQIPARAMMLFEWMGLGGMWVGVCNTRNAIKMYERFKGASNVK